MLAAHEHRDPPFIRAFAVLIVVAGVAAGIAFVLVAIVWLARWVKTRRSPTYRTCWTDP